jgi:hypothetical protein
MASMISEHESFQGVDGKPIVNGYIYVGAAGQDPKINPIVIYSDRELTTPIANPQRTDSYGRAQNKIWVTDRYSLKIEDSNGVQKLQDLQRGELADSPTINLVNVQGINAVTADAVPAVSGYVDKAVYVLTVINSNTGAVTLDFGGGAKAVEKNNGDALVAGDWPAGSLQRITYNAFSNRFDTLTFSSTEVNSKIAQAEQDIDVLQIAPPQITGLVVTNNATDAEHDIDISAGKFGSNHLSSGLTKRLDAAFEAGAGNGGMVGSLPASGVIYVLLITNGTLFDVYAEIADGDNPPAGWTVVKRIATRPTNSSSNLISVLVDGNGEILTIYPQTLTNDFTLSTIPITRTAYPASGVLSCPANVTASIHFSLSSSNSTAVAVTSLDGVDYAPFASLHDLRTTNASSESVLIKSIYVNNNRQIGVRRGEVDASAGMRVRVIYWLEDRG